MGSLIRLLAIAASALIAVSLIMFAIDQSGEGTETQLRALDGEAGSAVQSQDAIGAPNPGPGAERAREAQHSSVRESIDDGNDLLASPFTGIVASKNVWLERLVPAGLGLLLFGLGGLMLANWLPENRTKHHDWREAAS